MCAGFPPHQHKMQDLLQPGVMQPARTTGFVDLNDLSAATGISNRQVELMAGLTTLQHQSMFETLRFGATYWIKLAWGPPIAIVLAEELESGVGGANRNMTTRELEP